ncbi:MAG: protein-export chaperone SecB [Alphaproteobacteria bacterium]
MAENQPTQAPTNGSGEPPLIVRGQYVKDLSFENPGAPQSLVNMNQAPAVDVNVNVAVNNVQGNDFEVVLTLNASATNDGKSVFVVELAYAGVFTLSPSIPEEHKGPVLLIECPRLLFPFARAIVADATREGGFPPLMLQPIDFVAIYQQQATNAQQQPSPANA